MKMEKIYKRVEKKLAGYPADFQDAVKSTFGEDNCFTGNYDDDDIRDKSAEVDEEIESCLKIYNDQYDDVKDEIRNAEYGTPIYRGLHADYKSFRNALFHEGFTLDKWITGKEERKPKLGVCWTWDEDCARRYGECEARIEKDLIILKGTKPTINKSDTLSINMLCESCEKEIRLKHGSKIFLEEICHFEPDENKKLQPKCEKIGKFIDV